MYWCQCLFVWFILMVTWLPHNLLGYKVLNVKMPSVSPKSKEKYLCTRRRLPRGTRYAYKFRPRADQSTAHHMLVFACARPAQRDEYWECNGRRPCGGNDEQILYAWAKNAEPLQLPKHVAFPLGFEYDLNYIVIQIHYARPLSNDEFDSSGVSIYLTEYEPQFFASIYLFSNNFFSIPPGQKGYHVDVSCRYHGSPIKPFAFRTHAHSHSRSISAYRIRGRQWSLIGIGNPQFPQAFYPIQKEDRLLIKDGDMLVARCTYDTLDDNEAVVSGAFSSNEMCNFYMMYYTLNDDNQEMDTPFGCSYGTNKWTFPKDAELPFKTNSNKTTTNKNHPTLPPTTESKQSSTSASSSPTKYGKPKVNDLLKPVFDSKWNIRSDIKTRLQSIRSVDVGLDNNIVILNSGNRSLFDKSYFDERNFYIKQHPIADDIVVVLNKNDGSIMNSEGKNFFYLPSSLHINKNGYYFITDAALHQVFKFNPSFFDHPLLSLGQEKYPGNDKTHFCSPVAVVTDSKENIYVVDGLCNNRVIKFDIEGNFITEFGKEHFKQPRSLAIDGNHVYVGDLETKSIHVFDHAGNHLSDLSHGLQSDSISMMHCQGNSGFLYIVSDQTGLIMKPGNGQVVSQWETMGLGTTQDLAISRDHKSIYVVFEKPIEIHRFHLKHDETSVNIGKKVLPKFPWSQVKPSSTEYPSPNTSMPDSSDDKTPSSPYLDDDITVVPAVVVVAVLATPIILVLVALFIQHVRLKRRVNQAARRRTLDTYSKGGLCTCCCVTPRYYYDGKRGFSQLIKGNYKNDENTTSSEEEEEEEDLFTRKA